MKNIHKKEDICCELSNKFDYAKFHNIFVSIELLPLNL